MQIFRSLAAGAMVVGAASGLAVAGMGSAAAADVRPLPGGVEVNLSHADTVWAHQQGVGKMIAGIPNPSVASFGTSLSALSELASTYPQGRVAFTVFGPFDQLSGTMVALEK